VRSINFKAIAALTGAMLFWSLSFVWYKEAYRFFTPIAVIFMRLVIATMLIGILTLAFNRFQKIHRTDWFGFALLAFFEPFLYFMFESYGIEKTSPTIASIIIALIPLLTPLALGIFLKKTTDKSCVTGLAISFAGVVLVVVSDATNFKSDLLGVLLMFGAALSALGYSVILTRLIGKYNTLMIMFTQNVLAVAYFTPFFVINEYSSWTQVPFSVSTYAVIFKLAVFASFVAFTLFVYGVGRIGVTVGNMFTYLIPVFTAIFAYFTLGDPLSPAKILGVLIVIAGLTFPMLVSRLSKSG